MCDKRAFNGRTMDYHDSGISLSPSYRQLNNEFRFEIKRLQTFLLWPVDAPIESARIAKAGFYYTGSGQECQCFACNGKIQLWEYGDQAMARHRQMNPSCPFVLNRSANVPLSSMAEWNENQTNQYPQVITHFKKYFYYILINCFDIRRLVPPLFQE